MRRLLLPLAGLAAAAAMVAAVALVVAARDDDGNRPGARPRASMSVVTATVRPNVHHFGEPVVAELLVVADKALIDTDAVRVNPDFTPYEPIRPREVVRTETATTVRWRFRFFVQCLRDGCAPDSARRTMEFPGAAVVYRFRSAPGPGTAIVDWPPFEVTARVPDTALAPERWRADLTSLPAVTYGASARTLTAALLGGSFAFALLGLGLAWMLLRRPALAPVEATEDVEERGTALERALQLAREAALDGDSPERRRAFERAARELGVRGLPDLAERARALAWAAGPASPAAVDELARDAHAATNGGGS